MVRQKINEEDYEKETYHFTRIGNLLSDNGPQQHHKKKRFTSFYSLTKHNANAPKKMEEYAFWRGRYSVLLVLVQLTIGKMPIFPSTHSLSPLRWCVYFSDTFHGHISIDSSTFGQNWPRQFSGQSLVPLYGILASYPEHIHIMAGHLSSSRSASFGLPLVCSGCITVASKSHGCCYLSIKCAHNNRRKNCAINLPVIVLCLDEKETCENWLISTEKTSNETAAHYVFVGFCWPETSARARTHSHPHAHTRKNEIDRSSIVDVLDAMAMCYIVITLSFLSIRVFIMVRDEVSHLSHAVDNCVVPFALQGRNYPLLRLAIYPLFGRNLDVFDRLSGHKILN